MSIDFPCVCGHRKYQHKRMIKKTIKDYNKSTLKERRHPLQWYLDAAKRLGLEWACYAGGIENGCSCTMFKLDNLKYLESLIC